MDEWLRIIFWFIVGLLIGLSCCLLVGCASDPTTRPSHPIRRTSTISPPSLSEAIQTTMGGYLSNPRLPHYRMIIEPNGDWTFVISPSGVSHTTCKDSAIAISNVLTFNGTSNPNDTTSTYLAFWRQPEWEWPQYGMVTLRYYAHWWIAECCDSLGSRFPSYDAGPLIKGEYMLSVYGDCNAAMKRRVTMWPDSLIPGPPWLLREQLSLRDEKVRSDASTRW